MLTCLYVKSISKQITTLLPLIIAWAEEQQFDRYRGAIWRQFIASTLSDVYRMTLGVPPQYCDRLVLTQQIVHTTFPREHLALLIYPLQMNLKRFVLCDRNDVDSRQPSEYIGIPLTPDKCLIFTGSVIIDSQIKVECMGRLMLIRYAVRD
jgi:hypothetical protein